MIMNLSGGGKAKNVLAIWNGDSGATITATLGAKVLTTTTDTDGYAFFTNLDTGTWTLQATKTGRYVGSKAVAISSSQTAYYITYSFQTYLYDNSYQSAGANGLNVCKSFSGGYTIAPASSYQETYMASTLVAGSITYIYSNSTFDLTPFTTLYVDCICPEASENNPAYVGVSQYANTSSSWRQRYSLTTTSRRTVSVDVSSLNNVTGALRLTGGTNYTLRVYNAWLE